MIALRTIKYDAEEHVLRAARRRESCREPLCECEGGLLASCNDH